MTVVESLKMLVTVVSAVIIFENIKGGLNITMEDFLKINFAVTRTKTFVKY
jgi:hypothetical protein